MVSGPEYIAQLTAEMKKKLMKMTPEEKAEYTARGKCIEEAAALRDAGQREGHKEDQRHKAESY
jgi:hypothetical protein